MAITASLGRRNLSIGAKVANNGSLQVTNPIAVKTTINRLDQLNDVDSSNEVNNGVPVYDSSKDTYVIKLIDFESIDGPIDGGTF